MQATSCPGAFPRGRAGSCRDAQTSRPRGGSRVHQSPPGKGQPGAPRRSPPAPLGFRHEVSTAGPRMKVLTPPPTEVKRTPLLPATSPRCSPEAESPPDALEAESQIFAYKVNSRHFQATPQEAQPNLPTLIWSDHKPVLRSGVGEGWERLSHKGGNSGLFAKGADCVFPQPPRRGRTPM